MPARRSKAVTAAQPLRRTPEAARPPLTGAHLRFVKSLWYGVFAGALILTLVSLFLPHEQLVNTLLHASSATVALLAIILLQRGHLKLVLQITAIAPFSLLMILLLIAGSFNTPAIAGLPACIVVTGWLLGRRTALIMALICAAVLAGLGWYQYLNGQASIYHGLSLLVYLSIATMAAQYADASHHEAHLRHRKQSWTDPETGLPATPLLHDRLRQAIAFSARSESYGALLLIEHGEGPHGLLSSAQMLRLKQSLREGDSLAYYDAQTTALILNGLGGKEKTAALQARRIAAHLLTDSSSPHDEAWPDEPIKIGIALFKSHRDTLPELFQHAEQALDKARAASGNALCFHEKVLDAAVARQATQENELSEALASGQFELHYQTRVSETDLLGAEALLFWKHPTLGQLAAQEFQSATESTGLSVELDLLALRQTCQQLAAWAQQPALEACELALRINAPLAGQADLADQVAAILQQTGANPQRLRLEFPPEALQTNTEALVNRLLELGQLGVPISLDGLGAGIALLAPLQALQDVQLLINRTLARDILSNPDDAGIARSIISLGASFNRHTLAQGVDIEAHHSFLTRAGCKTFQGEFFSKNLQASGFEALVQSLPQPQSPTEPGQPPAETGS